MLQGEQVYTNWEILVPICPLEDRPEQFRNRDFINNHPLVIILELKKVADVQQKKEDRELESCKKKDAELPTS
jgi:hypothetical protein